MAETKPKVAKEEKPKREKVQKPIASGDGETNGHKPNKDQKLSGQDRVKPNKVDRVEKPSADEVKPVVKERKAYEDLTNKQKKRMQKRLDKRHEQRKMKKVKIDMSQSVE